jgi:hypothetical protein
MASTRAWVNLLANCCEHVQQGKTMENVLVTGLCLVTHCLRGSASLPVAEERQSLQDSAFPGGSLGTRSLKMFTAVAF